MSHRFIGTQQKDVPKAIQQSNRDPISQRTGLCGRHTQTQRIKYVMDVWPFPTECYFFLKKKSYVDFLCLDNTGKVPWQNVSFEIKICEIFNVRRAPTIADIQSQHNRRMGVVVFFSQLVLLQHLKGIRISMTVFEHCIAESIEKTYIRWSLYILN